MQIQHGSKYYNIYIRMISVSNPNNCCSVGDKSDFDELIKLEYPEVDVSKFNEYYNNLINEITEYISSGKNFNPDWQSVYIYFAIVNGRLIFGRYSSTVTDRMRELVEKEKGLLDGLLCKIKCCGWTVKKHDNGVTRVDYYTRTKEENPTMYPIYVYKDYLILGNADPDKPTFIRNNYFLYNAGEKIE